MLERLKARWLDILLALSILVAGVAGLVTAQGFRGDSGIWPSWIMALMAIGAVLVLAATLLTLPRSPVGGTPVAQPGAVSTPLTGGLRLAVNVGLLLAYVVAVQHVGLYASTAIYMFAHMLFLGIRPISLAAAASLGAAGVIWAFFGYVLGVSIPDTLLF